MKKLFISYLILLSGVASAQNVGIGTLTPNANALLHVELGSSTTKGFLVKGTYNAASTIPDLNAGSRMMFYPGKAAFRAGNITGTQWDNASVGNYSIAMGYNTIANANNSTAMGSTTTATGYISTAMGYNTYAGGDYSTAMGYSTAAGGNYSTAMGHYTSAGSTYSTAMGYYTYAAGLGSTAMGNYTTANANYSTAMGNYTTAGGNNSTAMGDNTKAVGESATATGYNTKAVGNYSTAMGAGTTATGYISTAMGNNTTAGGNYSASMGFFTKAKGFASAVIGMYNDSILLINETAVNSTSTSTPLFIIGNGAAGAVSNAMVVQKNGNVGIGNSLPNANALLHVNVGSSNSKGMLVTGDYNGGSIPDLNAGSRMMFYPGKAAFRAGNVNGTQWNNVNVGVYSTAMGFNTTAGGPYSTATGFATTAPGERSTAMGSNTIASGFTSTAIGFTTTASGHYSTAMGTYASTFGYDGSFVYGDNSTPNNIMNSSASNQFMVRAAGGTIFYSNNALTAGVTLAPGGGSWASVSDINRKENLWETDAEDILQKVSALPITNWNYKAQPGNVRHIGPMAQDFYAAFHLDGQSDTTINTLDIDGVNMAAIQALKTRTDELKDQNAMLNKKVAEIDELKKENENLKQSVAELQTQFYQQQKLIAQSLDQLKALTIKQINKETVAIK